MAQYKVPQDVEADDKLIGPFGFRQFVYLVIAAALIALMVALFQIFPLLAIIPIPFIVFFCALALPLKKDQPMETYLAAIVQYYLKPRTRIWMPGQREHTVIITAPKKVEAPRARNITGSEANHRLSFLAEVIDSEGRSIKNTTSDEFAAENSDVEDMFETNNANDVNIMLERAETARAAEQQAGQLQQPNQQAQPQQPIQPPPDPATLQATAEAEARARAEATAKARHDQVVNEMRAAFAAKDAEKHKMEFGHAYDAVPHLGHNFNNPSGATNLRHGHSHVAVDLNPAPTTKSPPNPAKDATPPDSN